MDDHYIGVNTVTRSQCPIIALPWYCRGSVWDQDSPQLGKLKEGIVELLDPEGKMLVAQMDLGHDDISSQVRMGSCSIMCENDDGW